MDDCVFCKIIRGDLPSEKILEDEDVLVFKTIEPQAPVHVLVVPKKHIGNIESASPEDELLLGQCQLIAKKAADKLGIGEAFRVLSASGKGAGQSVFHLHYHVLGGWKAESPTMEVEKGNFP